MINLLIMAIAFTSMSAFAIGTESESKSAVRNIANEISSIIDYDSYTCTCTVKGYTVDNEYVSGSSSGSTESQACENVIQQKRIYTVTGRSSSCS